MKTTFKQFLNENPDLIYASGRGSTFAVLRTVDELYDCFSPKVWASAKQEISVRVRFPCTLFDSVKVGPSASGASVKSNPMIVYPNGSKKLFANLMGTLEWKAKPRISSTHDGLLWSFLDAALGGIDDWMRENDLSRLGLNKVFDDFESREVGLTGRLVPEYVATWEPCGAGVVEGMMDSLEKARLVRFRDLVEGYASPDPLEGLGEMDPANKYWIPRRKSGRFSK